MGYLIEVDTKALEKGISYGEVTSGLEAAFALLAERYVASFPVRHDPAGPSSLIEIRSSLPRIRSPERGASWSSLIYPPSTGDWELSEVHRQLCQVGVLIQALLLVEETHPRGVVTGLSPTQQKGHDATGSDGAGGTWALEVFGGIDVRNNDKARKDAKALCGRQVSHRYFACFSDAWRGYTTNAYAFHQLKNGGTPEVRLMSVCTPGQSDPSAKAG